MKYTPLQKARIHKEGIDYFKTGVPSCSESVSVTRIEQIAIQKIIDERNPIGIEYYLIFESKLNTEET